MRSLKDETINPSASREYLKGRFFWERRTKDDFKIAIEHFQTAIAIDPDFALAYSGLSDCYIQLPQCGLNPAATIPQAKVAILKALELDPDLAEAHASLGQITKDFNEAEKEFKRAIELNPNYATAYQWYAELLYAVGRFDEARTYIREAIALDPMSRIMKNLDGRISLFERQYDEAIEIFKRNVDLDPTWEGDYEWLFHAYSAKGMYREAVGAYLTACTLEKQMTPEEAAALDNSFNKGGWNDFLKTRIEQFEERSRHGYVQPFTMAEFYARAGEKEEAFALLDKVVKTRDNGTTYIRYLPSLDNLRSDPRFDELLRPRGFSN